jgi:integrase
MTIEKLPSGNYRIVEMRNGKRIRISLDHKPTKSEAKELIEKKIGSYCNPNSFEYAADIYIKTKKNVLSPATIRGYRSIINNMDESFRKLPLDKMSLQVLQTYINNYSANHSPKSVRNLNGFVIAVLKYNGSDVQSPRLPQKEKKPVYIPTEEDVRRILQEFKGHRYEAFIILATMGLRRSEICALTPDDLKGNVLTINKALVQNENKEWVIKSTKTTESTRTIVIPDSVVELLKERGFYEGNPENLYFNLRRAQKRLGIPLFPLHKLRHFFASYMHDLGYSDKQIQEFGGWKTDEVMKTVYQHAMEMDKVKNDMACNISSLIS